MIVNLGATAVRHGQDIHADLFRTDRFVGADRIGDAKQVTFGLASQIFDNDSGNRLMNARAGQIFYFEDRRVSLDGVEDDAPTSDLIAEIDIWPAHHTRIASRLVFDEEMDNELSEKDLAVNYSNTMLMVIGYPNQPNLP